MQYGFQPHYSTALDPEHSIMSPVITRDIIYHLLHSHVILDAVFKSKTFL